jgi:hypothetical protein
MWHLARIYKTLVVKLAKIATEGLNFEGIIWGLTGEVNAIVFGRWDRFWFTPTNLGNKWISRINDFHFTLAAG